MAYIATLIAQPSTNIFRRLHIKRRNTSDGKFEATWQDITEFVKRWGTLDTGIDDLALNDFVTSGYNVVVNNDTGYFQPETFYNSKWKDYMTRTNTLVRVQAGLYDDDLVEYPTDTTVGVFVMTDEIPVRSDSNDVTLQCSSLQEIFRNIPAADIAGINVTDTASGIITKIRDHTDGSANFVFREFITSTSWTVTATTNNYNPQTATSLDGLSTWDLIQKLAQAEGMVAFIDRTGGFQFVAKSPRQAFGSSQFSFTGQNFPRPNIISIQNYRQDLNNFYSLIRLKHVEADTSTSFVTAGTTTAVSGTNVNWQQGKRMYEFENLLIDNTTTAQTLVNALFSDLSATLTSIGDFKTLFTPHIEVLDRVDVSYHSYDLADSTIWDVFDWDNANWSAEGENFDWDSKQFYVTGKQTDLDTMTNIFTLREVV